MGSSGGKPEIGIEAHDFGNDVADFCEEFAADVLDFIGAQAANLFDDSERQSEIGRSRNARRAREK